jgi:L-fuculose-phosphate aldolase
MKKVISLRDVVNFKANGDKTYVAPTGAIITPSARDLLRSQGIAIKFDGAAADPAPAKSGAPAKPAKAAEENTYGGGSGVAVSQEWKREHVKLFNSPEAQKIKEQIVSVGHRLWKREYCDGNGGNISYRIGPNEVICTPTLVSKGMLTTDDLCMVDLDGNQIAGTKKRTSEVFLHLEIMKANPKARACCHAHPPHATAYALVGAEIPTCLIPEMEVLVGVVAKAQYETPGTKAFAETVLPYCEKHNVIILQNHGVISWANDLEQAYWFMEIVDAYCRTLIIASHLGSPYTYIPSAKIGDLLKIKQGLGLPDSRYNLKEADYCACEFRPGVVCSTSQTAASQPDLEAVVQAVTDEVMKALGGGS